MMRRLLFPLIFCALALAGCYRQAEEPIQQISGSEAEPADASFTITTPVIAVEDAESAAESGEASDAIDIAPPTATSLYITPEVLPGQVEQPTVVAPTAVIIVPTNADGSSTRVFILPTPTLTFAEQLNPADGCVHSVVRGDTLYQLSLAYATTVEAFFEANQLDSDALSIGQLLLIPDCEPSVPEATEEAPPAEQPPAPAQQDGPLVVETAAIAATEVPAEPTQLLLDGQRLHIASAGETWASIALRYDTTAAAILNANELEEGAQLSPGQELLIPDENDVVADEDSAAEEAATEEENATEEQSGS